ncbi:MAG: TOBE domain-containing protein [Defluviitaleaceae bacterium]|nr:TOBE domain-containing protein [Defluviitaleaceae bacterium]
MKTLDISASNQFKGKVAEIFEGPINGRVLIDVDNGRMVNATVTMDSIERLGLKKESVVYAVVNPSDIMIFAEFP